MRVQLTNDELLSTTRVVRKRLDFSRPVERDVLEECLELAVQAPTASNRQEWHWIFVTDPVKKRQLGEIYASDEGEYVGLPWPELAPEDTRAARSEAVQDSAAFLRQHMGEAPVLLVPCHLGRVDNAPIATQAALWGSMLPAVWSFFLALRTRGLGSAWTSVHLRNERRAAEVLGLDYERYTQGGLFPIAYTVGTSFKPAARRPLAEITHWNGW
ncbi:MAG: nitroreductase [Frankiales bacterium]|jgi:nitroreductase|nr:nitroreductase [Frankiales bacterium]